MTTDKSSSVSSASGTADVKLVSPFDQGSASAAPLIQIETHGEREEWMPSRFNARSVNENGDVVLWNTLSGSLTVIPCHQQPSLNVLLSQHGTTGALDPLGRYLKDRGYIVRKGTHEFRQFQGLFGKQHYRNDTLELILLASEDCNLRCKYCYESFSRGTMEPAVRRNIRSLVKNKIGTIQHLSISWFGGEPLYGINAIEELAPFFDSISREQKWTFSSQMTTNAYLLSPETAHKLIGWRINKFQITLDGPREQHDANRPARDGSGTFDAIWSNLEALREIEEDFAVRLRINFDRDNHPHLDKLLCQIEKTFFGDSRFKLVFQPVGKWGGPNDRNLNVCGASESHELRAELQQGALRRGLFAETLADRTRPGGMVCYAARPHNFIIGAHGQVMKCTVALDQDPGNIVGVLGEGGSLLLDAEKFSKWIEPAFESDSSCKKCHLLPSCQGMSCPLIRFEKNVSPCEATCKGDLHNQLVTISPSARDSGRRIRVSTRE
jgi:uncharacterized protein